MIFERFRISEKKRIRKESMSRPKRPHNVAALVQPQGVVHCQSCSRTSSSHVSSIRSGVASVIPSCVHHRPDHARGLEVAAWT